MALQNLPRSAEVYGRDQRAEIGAAVSSLRRTWARMGDDFDVSWAQLGPRLLLTLDRAQGRVSQGAQGYIPAVLSDTGQRVGYPAYHFDPDALVGVTGDGRPTGTLAYRAVVHAKAAVSKGASVSQALELGGRFLTSAAGTLLSDTARTVEKVDAHARGVTTFVRMLEPPSCGRCVILAGQVSHSSEAFDRHERCDCRNIPVSENIAGDFLTDPRAHLDGLSDDELARSLGSSANAQAYRDGADVNQLVNAYRAGGDVRPAQVYGRSVKYTTEGTTRRGAYGRAARAAGRSPAKSPRLMPESIYSIATDRADSIRLLRLYGWIT